MLTSSGTAYVFGEAEVEWADEVYCQPDPIIRSLVIYIIRVLWHEHSAADTRQSDDTGYDDYF